ncbi:MAG: cellulase family glycosylhydrolase [Chitinispirillales bacterium]|jgi:endoglucanase|nr:cellulase family glycosylhydrolase [Chitinispirillales bacterium]
MKRSLTMLGAAVFVSAVAVGGAFAQISPQLPAPGEAPAGSPVAIHGALKTSGNKIVDKNNQAVTLRGMSLYWANTGAGGPYYNDYVVGWLVHDWKVSVVRAAIGVARKDDTFGGNAGYADGDSAGMVNLARTVIEACIRRGTYVLVDWHTHNRNDAAGKNTKGAEFLGNIAARYGSYPNVLFEPFNEPMDDNASVATYVAPIITRIRQSSQNLIIVGSSEWSRNPNGVTLSGNPTNVAFSFHFYTGTHSQGSFATNINSALTVNKAVVVTEFGTTPASGNGDVNESGTNTWITYLEEKGIGWMNWSICDLSETSGALVANSGGTSGGPWTTKQSGTWARNKIISYNGASGANYYPTNTYTVNVTATPSDGGSVEKRKGGAVSNGPYNWKDVVSVKAVPNPGWEIKKWTGDASGSLESMETTITGVNLSMGVEFYNGGVIKNGHFSTGTGNWSVYKNGLAAQIPNATIAWDNSQPATPAVKATITAAGSNVEDLSVFQNGLTFEQGRRYELSFEAKGASARTLVARASNNRAVSATPYLSLTANLGTSMAPYTGTFNMTGATVTNGRLDFDIGANAAAVTIANVKLRDIGTATGVAHGAISKPAAVTWSIANVGGVPLLRGPADAGAKASIYDTRGKLVRSVSAVDGLNIGGAGLSAGNYLLVVKNGSGAEVLRSKVATAK